jgi:hypothetical protein
MALTRICKVLGIQLAQENVMGKVCEKENQNLGFVNVGSF